LIKQKRFTPKFKKVKDPLKIISQLSELFEKQLKQKQIKLEIDSNLYGSRQAVTKLKDHGIQMEVQLYE